MGDEPLSGRDASTLHYATPARHTRRIRPGLALIGGMFLVLTGALTLIVGFAMIRDLNLSRDLETACAFAICIFSATCLIAGLPLIYRGSRDDD